MEAASGALPVPTRTPSEKPQCQACYAWAFVTEQATDVGWGHVLLTPPPYTLSLVCPAETSLRAAELHPESWGLAFAGKGYVTCRSHQLRGNVCPPREPTVNSLSFFPTRGGQFDPRAGQPLHPPAAFCELLREHSHCQHSQKLEQVFAEPELDRRM